MFKQCLRALRVTERRLHESRLRELRHLSSQPFVVQEKKSLQFHHCQKVNSFHLSTVSLAKNRDKKKDKKKVVVINEDELSEYFEVDKLMADFSRPLETFKQELVRHTTLRSSSGAIESLKVEFDGGTFTIQELAQVGKKNPRLIVLDFSSFPTVIPAVLKTFQNSELNINVQQEGTKVYVPIPKVTKDQRDVLAKKCKLYFVKCKEGVRDVQMRYIRKLGSIEKLSVEEKFRLTDQLSTLGNKKIQISEALLKEKQDELLKVEETAQAL